MREGRQGCKNITVLVAHKSGDVYGADLQLLESIRAMTERGWRVVVVMAQGGPLVEMIVGLGAEMRILNFPVLRRAHVSIRGFVYLARSGCSGMVGMRHIIREFLPDLVYVNTVALPWWLLVTRISRIPSVCHVHEAEDSDSRVVLAMLNAPLTLATVIISNSRASMSAMCTAAPWLRERARLVYNGVAGPTEIPHHVSRGNGPLRLAVIGRLSPRKAQDIALEASALLRSDGRNVELEICGTSFDGYEWYADQLHARASQPDLAGSVIWSGYVSPIWPALARADVILAPSLREPFGNAVVEAHLSLRPVVASGALGHLETVSDGVTGLLVPPGDAFALASAVARIIDDPDLAVRMAEQGRAQALESFSIGRYKAEIVDTLQTVADDRRTRRPWARIRRFRSARRQ